MFLRNEKLSVSGYEYSMLTQPLMLAAVLSVEPICFFVAGIVEKVIKFQ